MLRFFFKFVIAVMAVFILLFSFLPQNLNEYFIQPLQAEITVPEDIDLGIVLGAGLRIDGSLTDLAVERVDHAFAIFDGTNISLMFSGGKTPYGIEAEKMSTYARELGYNGKLTMEDKSTSTYENARFSDRILDERSDEASSIVLVTSSFHSRRALATFKKQMPERNINVTYPEKSAVLNNTVRARWKGLYQIVREYVAQLVYQGRFDI